MECTKFWDLEYYEWSLWLMRISRQHRKRREDQELQIELERGTMALMGNLWSTKKVKGSDFYRLSYDGGETEKAAPKLTGEELMAQMKERFKNKPIKKRG
jgi:hypothetical protein